MLLKGEVFSPASFHIHIPVPINHCCAVQPCWAWLQLPCREGWSKQEKLVPVKRLKEKAVCEVLVQGTVAVSRSWQQVVPGFHERCERGKGGVVFFLFPALFLL